MGVWLVGGYGIDMDGAAPGITALTRRDDGSLAVDPTIVVPMPSPSFLAAADDIIYATLEGSAEVVTLSRDSFSEIARIGSGGGSPCHLAVYGDTAFVTNYADGSVGVLDTRPLGMRLLLTAEGSGPHPAQEGPHAHASVAVVEGVIVTADLGADRLHVHVLVDGELARSQSFELPPGTGPRDLLLHPSGLLYVLGEHSRSIIVVEWHLDELVFVDSFGLPGAIETDQAAGLVVSPDGVVYALLRGSDRIAVLGSSVDGRSLERVGSVSSEGHWPRHLALDGRVLHVANQLSNSVASFALGDDGLPALLAPPTAVASPTYLLEV